jgi:5S rRNA maturation endonuclease (ribonuclease M5)/archaellum biogenesis ATPase FlaH
MSFAEDILKQRLQEKIEKDGGVGVVKDDYALVLCIYHPENNPSLRVDFKKKTIHCFGCNKTVSFEQFYLDLLKELGETDIRYDIDVVCKQLALEEKSTKEAQEAAADTSHEQLMEDKTKKEKNTQNLSPEKKIEAFVSKITQEKEAQGLEVQYSKIHKYEDEDGNPLFYRIRLKFKNGDKVFYSFNSEGIFVKDFIKLYRLPEVSRSDRVFFVEGETSVEALENLGFVATTFPIGAREKLPKPCIKELEKLQGKAVYVIPDNDNPGWTYAKSIYRTLLKKGAEPFIVSFSDYLVESEDVHDLIDFLRKKGKSDEEIKELILEKCQEVRDNGIRALSEIPPEDIEWVIPDFVPAGVVTLICGEPGVGKTTLAIVLAGSLTNGKAVPTEGGFTTLNPASVLYVTMEEKRGRISLIYERQKFSVEGANRLFILDKPLNFRDLTEFIEKNNVKLLIVDPFTYYAQDLNKTTDVKEAVTPFVSLAKKKNIGIVLVWHNRKSQQLQDESLIQKPLGSVLLTAMAKRIIFVFKDLENPRVRHVTFAKGKPTPGFSFEINEQQQLLWIKGTHDSVDFDSSGKAIANEIKKLLSEADSPIYVEEILKHIKLTFNKVISLKYLQKIKNLYLHDEIEIVRERTHHGRIGRSSWTLKADSGKMPLQSSRDNHDIQTHHVYQQKVVDVDETIENTINSPHLPLNKKIDILENTPENSLKINNLQRVSSENTNFLKTVDVVKTLENTESAPHLPLLNGRRGENEKVIEKSKEFQLEDSNKFSNKKHGSISLYEKLMKSEKKKGGQYDL